MEGLPKNTKEGAGGREARLKEAIEHFKNVGDRLGLEIDRNIIECVAVLNALKINTASSCGGHTEEGKGRLAFPYLYFEAPESPMYRFEGEMEVREEVAKKHSIAPEDVLREDPSIAKEFYKAIEERGSGESIEWKEWMMKNKELKERVMKLLVEFNTRRSEEDGVYLRFERIFPGSRIETIEREEDERLKRGVKKQEIPRVVVVEKVLSAQKEMKAFEEFLKRKYLSEKE
ncbi:MAG: hypothetical protein ACD_81C00142G0004 [uncultured bacterium]|uniref:Uncharacterized protein n=2 Tax=Candidatus Wolfeibacteriota TaxID=1752735 RepID=A0A0G1H8X7_9BACT|nr:MAG: hypothetical protein ACD_81C00142G0004 [uncultured bacterium]KKR12332.1 MAG: hypothetical protein UT41_C0002G0106 [Candidatus Wolfebacteria bacterium GW2011_GWC2_39_22]KKT43240.1 MAG: hypothetical protein UW32_C0002G0101 [Candidatus Wolfebacteria bacterium GW2011_GWE2_44_13]HBI25961.1 hypothetical protein [Candidatus Wolfebacteria bacterium]